VRSKLLGIAEGLLAPLAVDLVMPTIEMLPMPLLALACERGLGTYFSLEIVDHDLTVQTS
jgi:hypothetical protein